MTQKIGRGEAWEKWEIEFVAETYPDPEWSPHEIAHKLERDVGTIYNMASRLGIKRKTRKKLDWDRIAKLRTEEGLSHVAIAMLCDCSKGGVQRVLRQRHIS